MNNTRWTYRLSVASVASIFTLFSAPTTFAQEDDAESAMDIEEVVVTGSRIVRPNLTGTTPVVQVDSDEVEFQGTVRVEDMMRTLPQVWSNQNTGQSNGATGTATLNLRNLGDPRTLVLINGRRLPAGSPLGGGPDINQIPGALIDRVEVLTGGASATYGSDAVGGVVNFIMDRHFEGITIDYQASQYSHGNENKGIQEIISGEGYPVADDVETDGEMQQISLTIGGGIGGSGHAVAYFNYRDINPVLQDARDYSSCALNESLTGCYGSGTIPDGRVATFGAVPIPGANFDYKISGTSFVPTDGTTFNYGPLNYFQRPDERYAFGTFASYDIDDATTVYTELMFMDDRSVSQIAPSGSFFLRGIPICSNAFLSQQQLNALGPFCVNGQNASPFVWTAKRNVEGGPRRQDLRHTSWRMVFGARGEINPNWSYDISWEKGIVSMENTYLNDLSTTNIRRALDAVRDADGNIVCRAALTGVDPNCVPWNIFTEGAVTQDMINYLVLPLFARGTTDQTTITAYLEGDLTDAGWQFPSANEGVVVILGTEAREENLDFEPDSGFQLGLGAGQGGATNPVSGGFDVQEFFVEASIPVIEGRNLIQLLNLDTAYRYSDYSTGVTTHTWGVRAGWGINDQFSIRSSIQRAIRAANVRELFTPQGFNLFDMTSDPCGGAVDPGTGQTASGRTLEECARSGVTPTQFGRIPHSPANQYNFLQGGNPALNAEESDTFIVGFVYEPDFVPGLSITVDYYSIEITGGISIISPNFILEQCLDGDTSQCAKVKRSSGVGDLWLGSDVGSSGHIVALNDNLAEELVEGFDIIGSYDFDVGDLGSVQVTNITGYIMTWDQKELPTADAEDCNGVWGGSCGNPTPTFRNSMRATWDISPTWTLSGAWRFTGEVEDTSTFETDLDAIHYIDLAGVYRFRDGYSIRAGLNNVFDEAPPIAGDGAGPSTGGNGNVYPGAYDALGRYWYLGAKVEF